MEVQDGNFGLQATGSSQLDTVRALHQTVVSLRAALEASKAELNSLREKYQSRAAFEETLQKLSIENHILRRRIISSENLDTDTSFEALPELEHLVLPDLEPEEKPESDHTELVISDEYTEELLIGNDEPEDSSPKEIIFEEEAEENLVVSESNNKESPQKSSKKSRQTDFKTKIELQSKFDVTISVCATKHSENGTASESTTTTDSNEKTSEDEVNVEDNGEKITILNRSSEKIDMAVPTDSDQASAPCDRFNVQVRITSEENLIVDQKPGNGKKKQTENLNLDVDELSLRSMSEGDNSVFSEELVTPIDSQQADDKASSQRLASCDQDNISGNESEEVDDIELIFTTDETKDVTGIQFQEDLVSITDPENVWRSGQSESSTPILLKFNSLDPDTQARQKDAVEKSCSEGQEKDETEAESKAPGTPREKEPSKKPHLKSILGKSSSSEHRPLQRSMESTDSLSYENPRTLSFDNNTKSFSFERNSSLDLISREISFDQRDESLDQFDPPPTDRLGRPRFSLFVETDISKCGILEDEVSSCNMHTRRNTCPNPFQYRPIPHREALRGRQTVRTIGFPSSRARPILGTDSLAMRRENTAQTDVSALPNRWSSDGYLAHKVGIISNLTTLPSKYTVTGPKQGQQRSRPQLGHSTSLRTSHLAAPSNVHQHRTDEARRVMLSDIGFTSMVPELSRSADPLWACDVHRAAPVPLSVQGMSSHVAPGTCPACACAGNAVLRRSSSSVTGSRQWSVPTSPTRYFSKGSIQRSQSGSLTSAHRKSSYTYGLTPQKMYEDKPTWRGSLPELRGGESGDSTDELMDEVDAYLRRSVDNIGTEVEGTDEHSSHCGSPYLPAEPRHLKLGHLVKIITPFGRIAVGKVRYIGLAGGPTSTLSGTPGSPVTYIGVQLGPSASQGITFNDGTLHGRRYFRCDQGCVAIFVPFNKVVMAWTN